MTTNEDTIPIIDISLISSPSHQHEISTAILSASQKWGFFLLRNHPIPPPSITSMFSLSKQFFTQTPEDEKSPYPINSAYTGYVAPFADGPKNDKASMWFAGPSSSLSTRSSTLPPFWRQHVAEVEAFREHCHGLVMDLLTCFAIAMDLAPDYFATAHEKRVREQGTRLRLLCYGKRDRGPESKETTRMSAHTDSGSVTLLFQTCEGLEVEGPDGRWVAAPCVDGCVLVNLGDALAFWSGGRLKATRHRVTFDGVPHDVERLTMAYFGTASPETVLEPIKAAGDEVGELKDYDVNGVTIQPGITVGEYERLIMQSIYGKSVA